MKEKQDATDPAIFSRILTFVPSSRPKVEAMPEPALGVSQPSVLYFLEAHKTLQEVVLQGAVVESPNSSRVSNGFRQ